MLDRIVIDNFATIEHLSFDFGDGLNVITGETGAGKSVLVQAISTVLGGRADISMVRNGEDKAVIQLAGTKAGEEFIITRELLSSGKSHARLNGSMVTLAALREFCSDLADIHGQYDNQQILNPDNHILIADSYRHELLSDDLAHLAECHRTYSQAASEYRRLLEDERQARQQKDYFQFEYDYIDKLGLVSGEDDELSERLNLMKNSERIYTAVNTAYMVLHEDELSVLSGLSRCNSSLADVSSFSEELSELSAVCDDIYYNLEDLSDRLRDITSSLTFSEEELDSISERLSVIEDAKRKYHMDIDGILEYAEELERKLLVISNFDQEKDRLKHEMDRAYEALKAAAEAVSEKRSEIARELETAMTAELEALDFANSEFRINIERTEEITTLGFDRIEFLISTNPGVPPMPLARIASGGEISRVMLAFKHIIGTTDNVETMIFDEIDTGISGRTALTVGRKLKEISEHRQIITITHLPQIAAFGRDNYLITKRIEDGTSHSHIEHLDEDGKVRMVAALFSGGSDDGALEAARELIQKTQQ